MARVFAVMVRMLVEHYECRGTKFDKWPVNCHGCRRFVNEHWRSVAVEVVSEPEICHGAGFWQKLEMTFSSPEHWVMLRWD